LYSKGGGYQQSWHIDYDFSGDEHCLIVLAPVSAHLDLVVNHTASAWVAKFGVLNCFRYSDDACLLETFCVSYPHFLSFASDVAHAGARYDSPNFRFHMVLCPPTVSLKPNVTYPIGHSDLWLQNEIAFCNQSYNQ